MNDKTALFDSDDKNPTFYKQQLRSIIARNNVEAFIDFFAPETISKCFLPYSDDELFEHEAFNDSSQGFFHRVFFDLVSQQRFEMLRIYTQLFNLVCNENHVQKTVDDFQRFHLRHGQTLKEFQKHSTGNCMVHLRMSHHSETQESTCAVPTEFLTDLEEVLNASSEQLVYGAQCRAVFSQQEAFEMKDNFKPSATKSSSKRL